MASLVSKSYSKKLLRLISWSHWFTFFNICLAILLSSIYLFAEPGPETLIGQLYLVATWFSHIAFLTFVSFVLIVFPITLLFPYTRFIRGFASLVFTVTLVILVLDAFTYQALGYHLNSSSFEQILTLINNAIAKDSFGFYSTTIAVAAIILVFELIVSNYAWKHISQLQQTVFAKYTTFILVCAFIFSHVTHIWADANLHYDILKQDTLFPISHPSTAKTLLTKYGLFDKASYIEDTTNPLVFNDPIPNYPLIESCVVNNAVTQSTIMVLNKNGIVDQQIEQFSQRANTEQVKLAHHIDNASSTDAWFNLLYGLPTLYQSGVLAQNKAPMTFQLLTQLNLSKNLTVISKTKTHIPEWVSSLFSEKTNVKSVQKLIFGQHFSDLTPGLHVYYFDNNDDYQLELFVDALLLAQKTKVQKDIIWLSGLGNAEDVSQLTIKPALWIWPHSTKGKIRVLTSQMDVVPTLLNNWLNCPVAVTSYSTGVDLLQLNENRIIANSTDDGLMIFEKDKSVLVDANGNFQGFSRQLNAPILVKPDYPLMINGVKNIKRFQGVE
ncbi:MAG: DUF3413 domain-containing protein [Thalassotalea sp.]